MAFSRTKSGVRYNLDDYWDLDHTIIGLVNLGHLTIWECDENGEDEKLYDECLNKLVLTEQVHDISYTEPRYPYCCIIPHKSYDEISKDERIKYQTDYKLVVYAGDDLYFTVFTVSYDQIKTLHQILWKEKIYLPCTLATTHRFPGGMNIFVSIHHIGNYQIILMINALLLPHIQCIGMSMCIKEARRYKRR